MNDPLDDATPSNKSIWQNLVDWVHENGGTVHPNLKLRSHDGHRGVYAHSAIQQSRVLIHLPASLALSGTKLPRHYPISGDESSLRHVSAWLRCLAAYYQAETDPFYNPYIDSLPKGGYETLWSWSPQQRTEYLAGTSLLVSDLDDSIRERYQSQIRPYLEHVGLMAASSDMSESEYHRFSNACQAIRTRCFHLNQATSEDDGPHFLPVMDLLNHTSTPSRIHTIIRQQADGSLIMVAEQDIAAETEVLHSYGTTLTAAELLSTYGFVSQERIQNAMDTALPSMCTSSCLLSKQAVLEACWHVISSDLPRQLIESMQEQNMEDETWDVATDKERPCHGDTPDNYIIVRYDPDHPESLWSDELVTLACVPFLPACAAAEAKDALLDKSILQDYFLGKLVCAAMLRVIDDKRRTYTSITYQGREWDNDGELLRQVVEDANETRLQYALTVRMEEMASLNALRKEVIYILAGLGGDDESHDGDDEADGVNKRQRT